MVRVSKTGDLNAVATTNSVVSPRATPQPRPSKQLRHGVAKNAFGDTTSRDANAPHHPFNSATV